MSDTDQAYRALLITALGELLGAATAVNGSLASDTRGARLSLAPAITTVESALTTLRQAEEQQARESIADEMRRTTGGGTLGETH